MSDNDLRQRIADLTPEKRAILEQSLLQASHGLSATKIVSRGMQNMPCLTSFAQQRLWFLAQLNPNSSVYSTPSVFRLRGKLDKQALTQAFDTIVTRHESLRTTFTTVDGHPIQIIQPARSLELAEIDLSSTAVAEQEAIAQQFLLEKSRQPFDLSHDLMLRAVLIRLKEDEHLLLILTHHIASDGWSASVLYRELAALYAAFRCDQPSPLPQLPIQYADYSCWQREWFRGAELHSQLEYWKKRLAGAPAHLALPTDRSRPLMSSGGGVRVNIVLPVELTEQIISLSRNSGVTIFMMLLAALDVLLYRYTGQEDICIGSPIANRNHAELEGLIGYFANTLVLRASLAEDPTFLTLLERIRTTALEAYAHQDLPFEKLVEEMRPSRDIGHTPFAQVVFAFQNVPERLLTLEGIEVTRVEFDPGTAKFDLTIVLSESDNKLHGFLEYDSDLYNRPTIERMVGHFRTLLEQIAAAPDRRISELPILTKAERRQILVEWNATDVSYPRHRCAHELFEEQAAKTPDSIAVVFKETQMAYGKLNERANQLAHYLQRFGVEADTPVAIYLDRSPGLIIGLLAILKSGGAYVPLDTTSPAERISFMLGDTRAPVLITDSALRERLQAFDGKIISLDSESDFIEKESRGNLLCGVTPNNLAYIIYTSGSTGKPKGVEIPHRGVVRLLFGANYVELNATKTLLQLAPVSFDASTFEIWGSLLHGARCVLYPGRIPTADELKEVIRRHGVTTLWLTSSLFNTLIDQAPETLEGLDELLTGGEALSVPHIRRALERLPTTQIINGYGPTESTTFACCYRILRGHDDGLTSIPIGRPIPNTRVYILDQHLNPVPVGVHGEIYIGGDGLARGYCNHPEMTREKFILNPFGEHGESRLYKTGDRARYLPDGRIEFLGRFDNQIKMRGFRIEPEEIEYHLADHPAIKEAVVVAREDSPGDKRLVAYVVASQSASPSAREMSNFLAERLPDYMVPSAFVILDSLPLMPNGKVNRKVLPPPGRTSATRADLIEARDIMELQLVQIWEKALNRKPVGITDNFFDLGGHSLLAVQLFTHIQTLYGRKLPLSTLFKAPTIEKLAELLRSEGWSEIWAPVVPIQTAGSRPAFFCVASMDALSYLYLAKNLGPDQPFYALHPLGLIGIDNPQIDLKALASQYVEAMRSVQPKGPYFIGGMCSGGVIAFEMAQQLFKQGEEIPLLTLMDAPHPTGISSFAQQTGKLPQRLLRHLRTLWTMESCERLPYALARMKSIRRKISARSVSRRGNKTMSITELYWEPVSKAYRRVLPDYAPVPYGGRLLLLLGAETKMGGHKDPRTAWRDLATYPVEMHVVPGDHENMLREPNVCILAQKLRAALDNAHRTAIEKKP